MSPLPKFSVLSANYLNGSADQVKQLVGGEVAESWITNTCTVRMSRAFNYTGDPKIEIPKAAGLLTVKGKDDKNYALRVEEFNHWLRDTYGPPTIVRAGDDVDVGPFKDKTGIINWHVSGWVDASGHFTFWDKTKGLYEGEHHYFDMPTEPHDGGGAWVTKVELWEC